MSAHTTQTELKLIGKLVLEGELHCETGLHVGAGKGSLEIGGSDNPVIIPLISYLPSAAGLSTLSTYFLGDATATVVAGNPVTSPGAAIDLAAPGSSATPGQNQIFLDAKTFIELGVAKAAE